jgi:hypothetical protein
LQERLPENSTSGFAKSLTATNEMIPSLVLPFAQWTSRVRFNPDFEKKMGQQAVTSD